MSRPRPERILNSLYKCNIEYLPDFRATFIVLFPKSLKALFLQQRKICKELLDAIEAKDVDACAELLQEAFECCDAAPHQEGPHEDGEY